MLAKTCPSCGSPIFEYKGETLCVVCKEEASEQQAGNSNQVIQKKPIQGSETQNVTRKNQGEISGSMDDEFALTIGSLLSQIREETDTRRMKHLMRVVKTAAEAYSILTH